MGVLSPAQLAEFRRVIDEHDGTRPVIFDGDGSGYGAAQPASNTMSARWTTCATAEAVLPDTPATWQRHLLGRGV